MEQLPVFRFGSSPHNSPDPAFFLLPGREDNGGICTIFKSFQKFGWFRPVLFTKAAASFVNNPGYGPGRGVCAMVPSLAATCIGSFPEKDPGEAGEKILRALPEMPLWPQLPRRSFYEGMYIQFAEGLPGLIIDEARERISFTREPSPGELELFYANYLDGNLDYFAITDKCAGGLHHFVTFRERIAQCRPLWLKGQITGPVSFGLTVTDQERRPILYDQQLKEILTIGLAMKTRWQIHFLQKIYEKVLFFIDEPYLASIGSGIISLKPEEVIEDLKALIDIIKDNGAVAGLHCCGNTDWSLLIDAGIGLLSYDAFNFGENLLLYSESVKGFLQKGGIVAWGIVPTTPDAEDITIEEIEARFDALIEEFGRRGFDREELLMHSVITPSCGTSPLTVAQSDSVLAKTTALSQKLREKYGVKRG